jgi:hypothetical protein
MFWTGFGAGAGAAFIIGCIAVAVLVWSLGKDKEDLRVNLKKENDAWHDDLREYWQNANDQQKEQVDILGQLCDVLQNIRRGV